MIKGGLKGVDKALKKAQRAADSFEENRNSAVKEATLRIHEEAVRIVSENANGTPAVRYGPKRNVSVSKPGNAPHTDTGRLRQSIKFNYKDGVGQVGSNLKYAAHLEFGTEDVAPRPWLSTAVSDTSKEVAEIFQKWFNKAMKELKK